MLAPVMAVFVAAAVGLSTQARVDGELAVERARYAFVIGASRPFDEVYPRSVFERRVERHMAAETILSRVFQLSVSAEALAHEYDRIAATTKAPDQWEAIQKALGHDRPLIEEVVCRPLVVDRALRERFDLDLTIHARPHTLARDARARWLRGRSVQGARRMSIARQAATETTTEALLTTAKAATAGPRVPSPAPVASPDPRVSVEPLLFAVLEKQLRRPRDVTTIVEDRQEFRVFRLVSATPAEWRVEVAAFPKLSFDAWLEKVGKTVSGDQSAQPR